MPPSTNAAKRLPAVVLAAGESQRFAEGNKLLTSINGRPLVTHAIEACRRAYVVDSVVVVLGHEAERVQAALEGHIDDADVLVLMNGRWQDGLSASIHTAIDALPEGAPGVVFLPGDMPFMTSELIDRVAEASLRTGRISFPTLDDQKGHPTAIPRRFFDQLLDVKGDVGAFAIVQANWDRTEKIPLADRDARTQADIDTDDDLA